MTGGACGGTNGNLPMSRCATRETERRYDSAGELRAADTFTAQRNARIRHTGAETRYGAENGAAKGGRADC
jgi:hypothetical protein